MIAHPEKRMAAHRILVVDDDEYQLSAVRRLFMDQDYVVEYIGDGQSALEMIKTFNPDLVMLDLQMPGMDGFEVCRRIKADPQTEETMVMILSGRVSLEDRLESYANQADDFISKPYDPAELLAKVKILLRLKKNQEHLRRLNANLEELVTKRTRELMQRERQAMVGQMVQGIVHNFQNPLGVIHSRAEIALNAVGGCLNAAADLEQRATIAAKVKRNLEMIEDAAIKVDGMIDTLLSRGRNSATLERTEIDLNGLIQRELDFLDGNLQIKHGLEKILDLDSDLPNVRVVYSDFSQLIDNMVKNAYDAMLGRDVKRLTVATGQDDEIIFITFRDTGSGIAPEHLDRIFDPFFSTKAQRDAGDETAPSGTGMGLYVCSELMKTYGGVIAVRSVDGQGAEFSVRLPRASVVV